MGDSIPYFVISAEEAGKLSTVCSSLEQAVQALEDDQEFLLVGGVFTRDLLKAYIALKETEIHYLRTTPHPAEFDLYYSA